MAVVSEARRGRPLGPLPTLLAALAAQPQGFIGYPINPWVYGLLGLLLESLIASSGGGAPSRDVPPCPSRSSFDANKSLLDEDVVLLRAESSSNRDLLLSKLGLFCCPREERGRYSLGSRSASPTRRTNCDKLASPRRGRSACDRDGQLAATDQALNQSLLRSLKIEERKIRWD